MTRPSTNSIEKLHEERLLMVLGRRGPMTRAELSIALQLGRSTISAIVTALTARGVAVQIASAPQLRRGRPTGLVGLDPTAVYAMGVDFGHARVWVMALNAVEEVVHSGVAVYRTDSTWADRAELAVGLIQSLGFDARHLGPLRGVGIGVPGPLISLDADPALPHPDEPERARVVRTRLSELLQVPLFVDNNTRYAGLAEAATQSDRHIDDILYVRCSDGVGGAAVTSGRLLRGAQGLAAEIGHLTVDPNGVVCDCGRVGCLETIASVPAVLAEARRVGVEVADLKDLASVLATGPGPLDEVVDRAGQAVGQVLAQAAVLLNPTEIVIGGPLVAAAPRLIDAAARTYASLLGDRFTAAPVRPAALGDEDGARGAALVVIHQSVLLSDYALPEVSMQ
ncbi:ROK family transcriptional regulator [Pengzhenrongella phosphoraccumulans]|uniref:ROK family transcriptional regulator n=1 Tax=Pengzhenrongella phosphoraccumulans TaxID=3114394 RepID=UPI0038905AB4